MGRIFDICLWIIFIWVVGFIIVFLIYINYPEFASDQTVFAIAIMIGMLTTSIIRDLVYPDITDTSMTHKLNSCPLRKKYGLNYCATCPDGYACASK
jgi:magnesium-transporting ATPase (P-type)